MSQMYAVQPTRSRPEHSSGGSSSGRSENNASQQNTSGRSFAQQSAQALQGAPGKILSTGGLLISILLSLLFGLAYVVRSLKNVKLTLRLMLKRDDRAEKKY